MQQHPPPSAGTARTLDRVQRRVGSPHNTASRTQRRTLDLRLRCDRREGALAHLRHHGFTHVWQRAGDATPDHNQLRIEDVKKSRNRDPEVIAGRGERLERESVAAASLGRQSAHREVPFRINDWCGQRRTRRQSQALFD